MMTSNLGCSEPTKSPANAGAKPGSPSRPEAGAGDASQLERDASQLDASQLDASQLEGDASQLERDAAVDVSPILLENMLRGVAHEDPDKPANDEVAGYSSAVSAAPGMTIQLFVNVNRDQNVRWDLYRVGYYGGLGTRLVARGELRPVSVQPACPIDLDTGMIECAWAPAFDVTIGSDWLSGYYFFELVNDDGFGSRVPFVVREGGRRAPALVHANVNTWQAYNRWGGISIYVNEHVDGAYRERHGYRVSFDRPYLNQNEIEPYLDMIRFLEQKGYDISYTTNLDIDEDPSVLARRKLFMTIAHDEYWTIAQRDALEAARDQGVSLGFFSGNTGYWRVRVGPSSRGVPRRTMTCYKVAAKDPMANAPDTTVRFQDSPFARPENALIGVAYRTWSKVPGFPYIVTNARHWIYAGTGVKDYDALSNVVGSEWDGVDDNGVSPAGLEVVAAETTISNDGVFLGGQANTTIYYPTPTSLVFAAGTIDWGLGLGQGRYADARIERMTENVLARAGVVAPMPLTEPAPRPASLPVFESKVLAGNGGEVQMDDTALKASFGGPAGIAAGPDGKLYIVDRGDSAVRVLSRDGMVSTLVNGASAALKRPNGIAVDPHGTLYVSDPANNKIVRVSTDATVTPYAGAGTAGAQDASDPLLATFAAPRGLAIGPAGELYVADTENDAIRRVDQAGVTTVATDLRLVSGVAVGPDGAVYFSTIANGQIGVVRHGQVTILANLSGVPGNKEGPAEYARLQPGEGLLVDADRLVFADTENNRVRALALTGTPTISTLFGDGNAAADPSDAKHAYLPRGIVHFDGGYALTDFGQHRILWFKQAAPSP
jgi:sugar lactone lactonase YvrE